jgi:hypothetical protein
MSGFTRRTFLGRLGVAATFPALHASIGSTLTSGAIQTAPVYDLLIAGGRVIDASQGLGAVRDVAILNGRIAQLAPNIPRAMIRKGMTLDQVKAAKLTADYDPRWGATTGAWTTERFIEAAYQRSRGALSGGNTNLRRAHRQRPGPRRSSPTQPH